MCSLYHSCSWDLIFLHPNHYAPDELNPILFFLAPAWQDGEPSGTWSVGVNAWGIHFLWSRLTLLAGLLLFTSWYQRRKRSNTGLKVRLDHLFELLHFKTGVDLEEATANVFPPVQMIGCIYSSSAQLVKMGVLNNKKHYKISTVPDPGSGFSARKLHSVHRSCWNNEMYKKHCPSSENSEILIWPTLQDVAHSSFRINSGVLTFV